MTGSFVFGYFQLHDINTGFFFAFGAKKGKVEHHCIFTYFGPCFAVAERTANPAGVFFFAAQIFGPPIPFALALRKIVWLI